MPEQRKFALTIPADFHYISGNDHLRARLYHLTRGTPLADYTADQVATMYRTAMEALSQPDWGLAPLGYVQGGFNGTADSDSWHAPLDTIAYLNIYKPGPDCAGRITVIADDDVSEPAAWVDVITGQMTTTRRRRVHLTLPNAIAAKISELPGYPVYSVPFTSQIQFITALRAAHGLLLSPDAVDVIHALGTLPNSESPEK